MNDVLLHARKRWGGSPWVVSIVALLLFLGIFMVVGKIWHIQLHTPLDYSSDALEVLVYLTHNYVSNDVLARLSAPFGAQHVSAWQYVVNALFQFNGNLVVLCRWLTGDDVAALNLYFLLTFPLTFATAYYACRRLRMQVPFAFCAATLYAFMPYHFWRGEIHILESTYLLTPLYVLVLLRLWAARPVFWRHDGTQWRLELTDRAAIGPLVLLVFFGSFHYYHQFFFAILALAVGLAAWGYRRNWRHLSSAVALASMAMAVLVVKGIWSGMLSDPILHLSATGYPISGPGESEGYPLKLIQLLLPVQHHRWPLLAHLRDVYDSTRPLVNENSSVSLGMLGALGFAWVLGWGLLPGRPRMTVMAKFGWMSVIVLLVASMGGLSSIVSLVSQYAFGYGFPLSQARSWNRIAIYLGFFAYFGFFAGLQQVVGRIARSVKPASANWISLAICAPVLALGLWDQVPGPFQQTQQTKESYRSDRSYFAAMESHLGPESTVFQLPVIIHHTYDPAYLTGYVEQLRPYISTRSMRFSFGADYGSAQIDFLHHIDGLPVQRKLHELCAYGFSAILIHRSMLAHPEEIEQPLADVLGASAVRSPDGGFGYFPLAGYCSAQGLKAGDGASIRREGESLLGKGGPIHYDATDFRRKVGRVVDAADGTIEVTADAGMVGSLSFGPYRVLPLGQYEAVFHLASQGGKGETLGHVDVNGIIGSVATVLAKQELVVEREGQFTVKLPFAATSRTQALEFRVWTDGKATLTLRGVDIVPITKSANR